MNSQLHRKSKKGTILSNSIYLLFLIIALFLIFYLIYVLYSNIPGNPKNLNIILENNSEILGNSKLQFYPNMKFNHNNISYFINNDCDSLKTQKVIDAFSLISQQVELINFYPIFQNPDIEIICSENKEYEKDIEKDYFIAGEGGAKEIIRTKDYSIITNGTVFLYQANFKTLQCDFPAVELHEILHVFGFAHSEDKDSLMYYHLSSCTQKLDQSIINELNKLYSQENLPDLYFENLKAVKKGRYLDYDLTIKNSGLEDAKDVNLSVLDEGKIVESRSLGDLNFGAGITLKVENLKLIHKEPKNITFIIDMENKIIEISKNNNIAEIK
jgi:hypothetical protein